MVQIQKRGGQRAGQRQAKAPSQTRNSTDFDANDVVAAVEGLYDDQVKPVSRILRKRLCERLSGISETAHVDLSRLRAACDACPLLSVQEEEKVEWAALLVGWPENFVDVYDKRDPYPAEVWDEFRAFCEGPDGEIDKLCLPGGRCACAEELRRCGPPRLAEYSLGQVCHILELAMQQKRIIGYKNGNVVAFRHSQQRLKEQYADMQLGMPSGSAPPDPTSTAASAALVADLDTARTRLEQLLQDSAGGQLPLPNVKRLFLSRFNLQLSETAFGHSKMSDLLQDDRFSDICTVEFQNNGYVVSRKARIISLASGLFAAARSDNGFGIALAVEEALTPRRITFCPNEPLSMDDSAVQLTIGEPALLVPSPLLPKPVTPVPQWSLSPGTISSLSKTGYAGIVRGPFIHAALPPTTPWQRARRRIQSVPVDMGRDCIGSLSEGLDATSGTESSSTIDSTGSRQSISPPTSSSSSSRAQSPRLPSGMENGPTGLSLEALDRSLASSEQTEEPDNRFDGTCSLLSFAAIGSMTPVTPLDRKGEKPRRLTRRVAFCMGSSELILEEPSGETVDVAPKDSKAQKSLALTPGTLSSQGMKVQNTFINVPPALPTPFKKDASNRSSSVPKNMGKDTYEQRTSSCSQPQQSADQTLPWGTAVALQTPTKLMFPPTPWLSSPARPSNTPSAPRTPAKYDFPPTPW